MNDEQKAAISDVMHREWNDPEKRIAKILKMFSKFLDFENTKLSVLTQNQ